jgi:hypothetical protein
VRNGHVADSACPFHAEIVLLSVIIALFSKVRTTVTHLYDTDLVLARLLHKMTAPRVQVARECMSA